MIVTLIEGEDFLDPPPPPPYILRRYHSSLSWNELKPHTAEQQDRDSSIAFQAHSYMRSFLFQSFDDDVMEGEGLLSQLLAKRSPVRPLLIIGVSMLKFQYNSLKRKP